MMDDSIENGKSQINESYIQSKSTLNPEKYFIPEEFLS